MYWKLLDGVIEIEKEEGTAAAELTTRLERATCPSCKQADCYLSCDGSQGADEDGETEEEALDRIKYNAALQGMEILLCALAAADILPRYREEIAPWNPVLRKAYRQIAAEFPGAQ